MSFDPDAYLAGDDAVTEPEEKRSIFKSMRTPALSLLGPAGVLAGSIMDFKDKRAAKANEDEPEVFDPDAYLAGDETVAKVGRRKAITDFANQRLKARDRMIGQLDYIEKRKVDGIDGFKIGDIRKSLMSNDFLATDDAVLGNVAGIIEDAYDKAQKGRGLGAVSADALKRGYRSTGTMLYTGAKMYKPGQLSEEDKALMRAAVQAGEEADIQTPRKAGSIKDVKGAGDFLTYAAESMLENAPRMMGSTAAGLAGGLIGGPAGAAAGVFAAGLPLNTGEAVGDIVSEGRNLDRGFAIAQGAGYSALDAAFGGEVSMARVLSSSLRKTAAQSAKKSFVHSVKTAGREILKEGLGEAVTEPAQSQIIGRGVRLAQTGSALRTLPDGSKETGKDIFFETADESIGGFLSAIGLGAGSTGYSAARNARLVAKADRDINALALDVDVQNMHPYDRLMMARYVATATAAADSRDALSAGQGTDRDVRNLAAFEAGLQDILSAVDKGTADKIRAFETMFADTTIDAVPQDFEAERPFVTRRPETVMREGGETVQRVRDEESSGITIEGNDGAWSVFNEEGMKMPRGSVDTFTTVADAVSFAKELARYNEWRAKKNATKAQYMRQLAETFHPGANIVLIDSPQQVDNESARRRMVGGEQAFYSKADDTVYIMLDALSNPIQAAVVMAHESGHKGLADLVADEAFQDSAVVLRLREIDNKRRMLKAKRADAVKKQGADSDIVRVIDEQQRELAAEAEQLDERVASARERIAGRGDVIERGADAVGNWARRTFGMRGGATEADVRTLARLLSERRTDDESGGVEYRSGAEAAVARAARAKDEAARLPGARSELLRVLDEARKQAGYDEQRLAIEEERAARGGKTASAASEARQEQQAQQPVAEARDMGAVAEQNREADPQAWTEAVRAARGDVELADRLFQKWREEDTISGQSVEAGQPAEKPAKPAAEGKKPTSPLVEQLKKRSFQSFFDAHEGQYELLQYWYQNGKSLFSRPKRGSGGEYDAFKKLPKSLQNTIVGKKPVGTAIDEAVQELAGTAVFPNVEKNDPQAAGMLVDEFVRQYNEYKKWKEGGAPTQAEKEDDYYEAQERMALDRPQTVDAQDMDAGDLVKLDGEWHSVEKLAGDATILQDEYRYEVNGDVKTQAYIRRGAAGYELALEEYKAQEAKIKEERKRQWEEQERELGIETELDEEEYRALYPEEFDDEASASKDKETAAKDAGKPALTLDRQTPEEVKAERERLEKKQEEQAKRDELARRAAAPIKGTAGDLTADMFGEQEGETPLFNARRDTPAKPSAGAMQKEAQRWQGAHMNAEKMLLDAGDRKGAMAVATASGKSNLDDYLMKKFGVDRATAHEVSNTLTQFNIPADRTAKVEDFAGEEWADAAIKSQAPHSSPTAPTTPPYRDGAATQAAQAPGEAPSPKKAYIKQTKDGIWRGYIGGKLSAQFDSGPTAAEQAQSKASAERWLAEQQGAEQSETIEGRFIKQLPSGRWVVQSEDNRQRAERGEREIGGDRLFASREEAVSETKREIEIDRRNAAFKAAAATAQAEREAAAAKREAPLNAYLDTIAATPLQRGKLKATLSEQEARRVSATGKVYSGSRFEVVNQMVGDGFKADAVEVDAIKDLPRVQRNRMDERQQREWDARKKAAGKKTEYRLVGNDGAFYVVTKVEHDLAKAIEQQAPAARTAKVEDFAGEEWADAAIESQATVKDYLTTETETVAPSPRFKHGAMATTLFGKDGVAYTGRIAAEDAQAGTVTIRATKERRKGRNVIPRNYGIDKEGKQITKDVTLPYDQVRVTEQIVEDVSKMSDTEKRKLSLLRRKEEADAEREIREGEQGATDVVDRFNAVKEREERERTDNADEDVAEAQEERQEQDDEEANGAEVRFRRVTDQAEIDKFNSSKKIRAYAAMQLVDGKLVSPMAGKINGKWVNPTEIGALYIADERPEIAKQKKNGRWYFTLHKGNGETVEARYNPYFHSSLSPLNDQFKSAFNRDNLVTVEVELSLNDLNSGYKAEKAKDTVGEHSWKAGEVARLLPEGKERKVFLSQYRKVIRVVPDGEVAEKIAKLLEGLNITVPENVVTPSLKEELIKQGVAVGPAEKSMRGKGKAKQNGSNRSQRIEADNAIVTPPDDVRFRIAAYHGTPHTFEAEPGAPFGRVKKEKVGTGEGAAAYGWGVLYAAQEKAVADTYTKAGDPAQRFKVLAHELAKTQGRSNTVEVGGRVMSDYEMAQRIQDRDAEFIAKLPESIRSKIEQAERGNLYHVELDFDPEDTLDWDLPLSEQSEKVRAAVDDGRVSAALERYTQDGSKVDQGADVYYSLTYAAKEARTGNRNGGTSSEDDRAASEYLASLGIKGIRYADQQSRTNLRILKPTESVSKKWVVGEAPYGPNKYFDNEADAKAFYNDELAKRTYNYVVFNEADIRVVGRNGETLTPTQAMDEQAAENDDTRFRRRSQVTPEQDAAYMKAVESGDMETAQRMVDAAAKAAGYNVGPVYHGTPSRGKIKTFDANRAGKSRSAFGVSDLGWFGKGFYFAEKPEVADMYRGKGKGQRIAAYLAMSNPINLRAATLPEGFRDTVDAARKENGNRPPLTDQQWSNLEGEWKAESDFRDKVFPRGSFVRLYQGIFQRMGFDSVRATPSEIVVFSPSQIKSADAVTYDDAGRVIPLSERFNEGSDDIRFRRKMTEDDYRGSHRAPTGEFGEGSLDAMDRTYPKDIYDRDAGRIYGDGSSPILDSKIAALIRRLRGKPDAEVTVFRAVPKGVKTEIEPGNWVTPVREYAEMHGGRFDEGTDIIERKVKAGELFTEGNSLYEYGWQPNPDIRFRRAYTPLPVVNQTIGGINDDTRMTPVQRQEAQQRRLEWAPGSIVSRFNTLHDKLRTGLQDNLLPAQRLYESVMRKNGVAKLPDDMDFVQKARVHSSMLAQAAKRIDAEYIDPMLQALSKGGLTLDELRRYSEAKHAPFFNAMIAARRNGEMPLEAMVDALTEAGMIGDEIDPQAVARIFDSIDSGWAGKGLSDENAARIVAELEAKANGEHLKLAHERLMAMNRSALNRRVESGLMGKAEADMLQQLSPFYVPLHVEKTDEDAGLAQTGSGGRNIGTREFKRALGHFGEENVDVIAQSLSQAYQAEDRALENEARKALLKFAEAYPDASRYEVIDKVPLERVAVKDEKTGQIKAVMVPKRDFGMRQDDPVIIAKVDGQKRYIKFIGPTGRSVAHAVKGDLLIRNQFLSLLQRYPLAVFKMVNTAFSPEFMLTNPQADFIDAMANLSADNLGRVRNGVVRNLPSAWRALAAYDRGRGHAIDTEAGRYLKEAADNGMMFDAKFYGDTDRIYEDLSKKLEKAGGTRGGGVASWIALKEDADGKGLPWLLAQMDRANGIAEMGTRLSIYISARKNGIGVPQAVELARNVTVDFHRKGNWSPILNTLYAFSNVGIQATYRMGGAMIKSKKGRQVAVSIVALGFVNGLLNAWMNGGGEGDDGEDEYKKLDEWYKEGGAPFRTGGKWYRVRMRGIPAALWYAGQKMADVMTGYSDPMEASGRIARKFVSDVLNPLGSSGSIAQMLSPTLTDPVVQISENKRWTGRDLVPQGFDKYKPDSQKAYKTTPEVYKKVAEVLNALGGGDAVTPGRMGTDISPETFKLWTEFIGGGTLRFITRSYSAAVKASRGDDIDVSEIPFVRSFVYDADEESRQNGRYWEARRKFDRAMAQYKGYDNAADKRRVIERYGYADPRTAEALKTLDKRINRLRENEDRIKDPARKDALRKRRLALQNRYAARID